MVCKTALVQNASRELCGTVIQNCKKMRDKLVYPQDTYLGDKNAFCTSTNLEFFLQNMKIIHPRFVLVQNAKSELSILFESNKDKLKNDNLI